MSPRWDKLLVLDLDDTLIHARPPSQASLPWPPRRVVGRYRLYLRPGVHEFMRWALDRFAGVAIWTSANVAYAHAMLACFIRNRDELAFIWSREQCVPQVLSEDEFVWHKDIERVIEQGWRPEQILIVDDKPEVLRGAEANAIIIPRFEGDPRDRQLLRLQAFLDRIGPLADPRATGLRTSWAQTPAPDEFDLYLDD